jgi:DNA-directed RNA polymerase specialized sigma24 family protein
MTNEQFEKVYFPKYRDVIHAIARKYARDDLDLFDDLVSAATIGLLALDPAKASSNEDAFIRNILRNKTIDFLRWQNRRDFERLDTYLLNGHDVVHDPITNEPMFVHGDNKLAPQTGGDDVADQPGKKLYSKGDIGVTHYANRAQRLAAIREFEIDAGFAERDN